MSQKHSQISTNRFTPKAERLETKKANTAREAITALELPQQATDDILLVIQRHETGGLTSEWWFNMISPAQCLLIWNAILEGERPHETRRVFDYVITHIEPNTGFVTLSRDELASAVGISSYDVSRAMTRLENLGAITRERIKVPGMKGPGKVRYRINPHVGWNGKLEKREVAACETPAPLSVVAKKKPLNAEAVRQLILVLGLPERESKEILTILERHQVDLTANKKLNKRFNKKFNMINPDQCLGIWKAIEDGEKPKETRQVFDYAMTHIEANTGVVTLSCDELAVAAGIAPKHVRSAMARLEEIGAIIREQVKVPGMPGPGNVIYRLNPHVGWNGKLEKRAASSRKTRVPFTVITGGKSSDGAGKDDPPEDAGA